MYFCLKMRGSLFARFDKSEELMGSFRLFIIRGRR